MIPSSPVSIHGGHSSQFCSHARNTLEEMVQTYIEWGFPWVGITEHMPPVSDHFVYPEEKKAGLNAADLKRRFADYITTCRRLQAAVAKKIHLFVGFETETCSGSLTFTQSLISNYSPDYLVGSVHHVKDIPFDYSQESYDEAAEACGGIDNLYVAYFDQQYEMIRTLRPQVVGHLDLIRIYDPDYLTRLTNPKIWQRIERNLELIRQWDLILDFNLRPLSKGEDEPYLSPPILKTACLMGIAIVPGDDSHSVNDIGQHLPYAMDLMESAGADMTQWRSPVDTPSHGRETK